MSEIIEQIRRSICHVYSLDDLGHDDYLIHTNKYFDDGDELHIVLKIVSNGYELTDEGHTLMWLSYEDYNFTPIRESIRNKIIEQNGVELDEGRIFIVADDIESVGDALSSIEQAIIQIADMRRLSRNNVANTFFDDILESYRSSPLAGRCDFKKKIQFGTDTIEPDVYIDDEHPILVFGVNNSERAKETFINLLFARNSNVKYRTIVVIDEDAEIPKKDHKRLINTADRPIVGLEDMIQVTEDFVRT